MKTISHSNISSNYEFVTIINHMFSHHITVGVNISVCLHLLLFQNAVFIKLTIRSCYLLSY